MATKREQLEKLVADMRAAADTVDAKRARGEEPSGEELAAIVKMGKDARTLKGQILEDAKAERDAKDAGEALEDAKAFLADLGINPDAKPDENTRNARPGGGKGKTLGERFAESEQFKTFLSRFPDGRIPDRASVSMDSVGYRSLLRPTRKDLITGLDPSSAGALITPQQTGIVDPGPFGRTLTMRDIITVGRTDSDTVEFVRVLSRTNNAAPVPEASSSAPIDGTEVTDVEGGLKPESALTFERETAAVKTVAHWVPITRRALADAGQMRTYIDQFLRDGLEEELEDQMVAGDGTGENFEGILATSGIQTHPVGTDTLLDAYRKAKTKVRLGGKATPTAYLMNPVDWEQVDLTRNDEGDYYFGGPANPGAPRLWGLPVVESDAVPAGTAFVADFRSLVLWDREQAAITVSDSHADFFIRNLLAILAEMRAAFTALRPAAIVKITGV